MCIVCAGAAGDATPAAGPARIDGAEVERGRDFVSRHATVDIHAHPGRFFLRGMAPSDFTARYPAPDPETVIAEMREAGIAAVAFATVADAAVLAFRPNGLGAGRDFAPGEAPHDHDRQLGLLDDLARAQELRSIGDGGAVADAHRDRALGMIVTVEGGDFIEDRLDRVAAAAARGVRAITVIHYRTNQIGDTQTEPPTHGGLTPLGRDTIGAMERSGILVDVAHASFATTADIAEAATRPLVMSHSNVAFGDAPHPRLVSPEHAKLVTQTGGLVGAVAAGFGQQTFDDYADTICRMIDLLGIDHVAVGTDMDFTYRPVMTSYRQWPALAGKLLARGLDESETAQVMGGNYMRLMR